MPSYKLCYFNAKGLGEMIRFLFIDAGESFEDVRYTQEDWPKHKPDMLFNKMPVLFVDGEQIAHSRAAFRYVARKFNYLTNDDVTAAKIDMWMEVIMESVDQLPFAEKDEKIKKEKSAEVMKDVILPKLLQLEGLINPGVYIFGKDITALDIFVYSILSLFTSLGFDQCLESLPKIKAMMGAVEARPKIAKWIAERPQTAN